MSRVFITGSTDGLGRAAALSLLDRGHRVVLHARTRERAAGIADLAARADGVVICDLRSAADVRGIAGQVNALGAMDAVIHNAGVYLLHDRGPTVDGRATVLAVNTLAPYLLTALLARPSRLIYVSSGLHRGGEGSLHDLDWKKRPWDAPRAYAESKLHVVALVGALARRWPGVICSAVDPGWVRTRMGGASAPVDIDTGQHTQTWLATSDAAEARRSGGYWHRMRREPPAPEAADSTFQQRLIDALAALTGVTLPSN